MLTTTLAALTHNTYALATAWLMLALLASVISIRVGISVALAEMVMGVIAGNLFHLPNSTEWMTFLAGFGFSHMTQWGRAAVFAGVSIDSLREEVEGAFDRRGEYLYEEGYAHPGFTDITFKVHIDSPSPREQLREFVSWADRSPPHATLRRAVRLTGIFYVNGQHLATAIYHPDRTEWRGYP